MLGLNFNEVRAATALVPLTEVVIIEHGEGQCKFFVQGAS